MKVSIIFRWVAEGGVNSGCCILSRRENSPDTQAAGALTKGKGQAPACPLQGFPECARQPPARTPEKRQAALCRKPRTPGTAALRDALGGSPRGIQGRRGPLPERQLAAGAIRDPPRMSPQKVYRTQRQERLRALFTSLSKDGFALFAYWNVNSR